MLGIRLVRLIEEHSEELANALVRRVRASHHASAYKDLSTDDIREIAAEVYKHLGDWLVGKTEAEIESYFTQKAHRRAEQHIPLSDLIWALMVTKENLWRYLQSNAPIDKSFEILGEMELVQMIDQFFDRGIYYVSVAYETPRSVSATK